MFDQLMMGSFVNFFAVLHESHAKEKICGKSSRPIMEQVYGRNFSEISTEQICIANRRFSKWIRLQRDMSYVLSILKHLVTISCTILNFRCGLSGFCCSI